MGGGGKGGPTSGGMMSTPRAMGPGSTSTMGKKEWYFYFPKQSFSIIRFYTLVRVAY